MSKKILGVRLDILDQEELKSTLEKFLNLNKFHQIATVNPEFLVEAYRNNYFKNILSHTSLNLIDGTGLQYAYFFKHHYWPPRLPGVDLMDLIFTLCQNLNLKIALLGAKDQIANKAKQEILLKYKKLEVACWSGGKIEKTENTWQQPKNLIAELNQFAPQVILVGLGNPKQEIWLYEHSKFLPTIKLGIGIGGSFDYLAKHKKRAPLFLRQIGLEWLYRLYQEPWRWRRILKATFVFIFLLIFSNNNENGQN